MAKSTLNFVCPVTNKRAKPILLDEDAPEGEFILVEAEEGSPRLPVGWGRLTLEIVVANPAVAEVQTMRAAENQLKNKLMEDPEITKEQKELVDATWEATLDEKYPMPESTTLVKRLSFDVLSDEAVAGALGALKNAGFPIKES